MYKSLVPLAGLLLLASAAHAQSPAQRATELDARLKAAPTVKKSAELILKPDGYKTDAEYFIQTLGSRKKIVALAEGESEIRWTLYFEGDRPFYAVLTEEGRNGKTAEYISFTAGAYERVTPKFRSRVALSAGRKKFLLETARRFLSVAQSK